MLLRIDWTNGVPAAHWLTWLEFYTLTGQALIDWEYE